MKRLALLLPIWLLLAAGENAPIHTCAMHGSHSAPTQHEHHHGAGAQTQAPAPAAGCTCIGDCFTPVPPSVPTAATVPMARVVTMVVAAPAAPSFVIARETPRLLPYSNGPPVSAL